MTDMYCALCGSSCENGRVPAPGTRERDLAVVASEKVEWEQCRFWDEATACCLLAGLAFELKASLRLTSNAVVNAAEGQKRAMYDLAKEMVLVVSELRRMTDVAKDQRF